MVRDLYRHHDKRAGDPFVLVSCEDEAYVWNREGYGIFWTVNDFAGEPRRIENCVRILSWAVDLDTGTKDEQLARIDASPLFPTFVVETARGFHVYWDAIDGTIEGYRGIVDRIVPRLGADPAAKDVARCLRAPDFWHHKGEPYHVRELRDGIVSNKLARYTEAQMRAAFGEKQDRPLHRENTTRGSGSWDQIHGKEALTRLSGHWAVNGEIYTFKRTPSGWNILANGKGTSAWIDHRGRIGSPSRGGPTILQWLRWFGRSRAECLEILADVFPGQVQRLPPSVRSRPTNEPSDKPTPQDSFRTA